MLSKKTKGLFLEANGNAYQVAVTSALAPPLVVESLHEIPRSEEGALKQFLEAGPAGKGARYLKAQCAVVPESRFFRLHQLENPAKAKDPAYFFQLLEEEFKIASSTATFSVLNAGSGASFDPSRPMASQKDLFLCGAKTAEILQFQEDLVAGGVFPLSLQLANLSSVAGLRQYLRAKAIEEPVLMVEMSQEAAHFFIISQERIELCRPVNFGFDGVLPIIQKELGLKDPSSARDLFFSNTFDFREIGSKLLARVLKELNSSTGFFEVQTGQTISYLYMTSLPENLSWIPETFSSELQIEILDIDWDGWATEEGISFGDQCAAVDFGPSKFGLFSLMLNLKEEDHGTGK